jgi:release factor glutamine methyltransferase
MPSSPRIGRRDWPRSRVDARPGAADTLESILAEVAGALATAGYDQPRRRARQLIAGALGLSAAELLIQPERAIGRSETVRLLGLAGRMTRGEPLSRVLGRREFWGLDFALSDETLDPRPESETIVEAVLARVLDRGNSVRLLDLGTGTGCLLLALLSELPTATGFGIDLSEGAAATARRNAAALGLASRARFLVGDWGSALAQRFDVIVANPPYIATTALSELPRHVSGYDPRRALDGGEDGLAAYRCIARGLPGLLAPSALFVGEVGAGQAAAVAMLLKRCGLSLEAIVRDLAGIERCVVARGASLDKAELSAVVQKNLGMCRRHV